MARFSYVSTKNPHSFFTGAGPTILLFSMIVAIFIIGTGALSKGSTKRQKDSLTDAITRDIIYCYATNGHYPESLDTIKKDYGLMYDEELFFVAYNVRAKNIIPDVTIIELNPSDERSVSEKFKSTRDALDMAFSQEKLKMKRNILRGAARHGSLEDMINELLE